MTVLPFPPLAAAVALTLLPAGGAAPDAEVRPPAAAPAPDTLPDDTLPKAEGSRPPVGRDAALELEIPPLEFEQPEVQVRTVDGDVPVFYLEDRNLPLVDVYARFRGGYALWDREYYGVGTALPSLLRTGGTRTLPPDSVDRRIDFYALSMSFGGGGESSSARVGTLTEHLDEAVELWGEMLRAPRFDSAELEIWRGRTLESVRRRRDRPVSLAYSRFNRLLFGDHPTGWELTAEDLAQERVTPERLEWLHSRIFCRENLVLGVAGDVAWTRAETLLEEMLEGWPSCPEPLPEPRPTDPRREGGVFLIPRDLSQSTVVMAEPGGVRTGDRPDYFASRIGNSILGGSGFTSRLVSRVRTELGLAYSVSSLWTAPLNDEGIVGAVTRTRAPATVSAVRSILRVMEDLRTQPPEPEEVELAVDRVVNGFVFNFEDAGRMVSRRMAYEIQDLPGDWLERYVEGIQAVDPTDVHRVVREQLHPDSMTILVVGDTTRFDEPLDALGEVRILEP